MFKRALSSRAATAGLILAVCAATSLQAAKATVPEVSFPEPFMEKMHEAIVHDYRPILRAKCSTAEMAVVEKAWRFQSYAMFAGNSKSSKVRAFIRSGTEATKQAIGALSPSCRKTYWQNQ